MKADDVVDLLGRTPGLWVNDEDGDDDPVLLRSDGSPVDTWREHYPYNQRLERPSYERDKRLLQIELLKLQYWLKDTGGRLVILFEGRDAAGKGGTIKRFMEHLNPRGATVVALEKPSERERSSWYFQRYISHMPAAGEIVMFDRSWYNRAGVERVMGFCTDEQYEEFMVQAPMVEQLLVRDGIKLVKLWFSVSRAEQRTRFVIRQVDPVRQWKLLPDGHRLPGQVGPVHPGQGAHVHQHRHRRRPWTVIKSNDKKRGRVEAMRYVLSLFDYEDKDKTIVGTPDSPDRPQGGRHRRRGHVRRRRPSSPSRPSRPCRTPAWRRCRSRGRTSSCCRRCA